MQFRLFSQQVVDIARQDGEEDHPMIGGEQEDAISDDVRSPITLSPDRSAASEVDGVDVPVPGTPPGEDFWEAWLSEIAESEAADRAAQSAQDGGQGPLAEDDHWQEIYNSGEGPDPRYELEAYDFGVEYAAWLSERTLRPPETPMTEMASLAERNHNRRLQRLQPKQDSEMALLVNAILDEPAELELPMEVAYMSGLVSDDDAFQWSESSGTEPPMGVGVLRRVSPKQGSGEIRQARCQEHAHRKCQNAEQRQCAG